MTAAVPSTDTPIETPIATFAPVLSVLGGDDIVGVPLLVDCGRPEVLPGTVSLVQKTDIFPSVTNCPSSNYKTTIVQESRCGICSAQCLPV